MLKRVLITITMVFLLAHVSLAWATDAKDQAQVLALRIADLLTSGEIHVLDIRCGEWTPSLKRELSSELLKREFDLRETHSLESFLPENEKGVLVQVDLNLDWQQVEEKNFFSYTTRRIPVSTFVVKQVSLPENRLLKLDSFEALLNYEPKQNSSAVRLRWFDPLIAISAVASIVFLLWTME